MLVSPFELFSLCHLCFYLKVAVNAHTSPVQTSASHIVLSAGTSVFFVLADTLLCLIRDVTFHWVVVDIPAVSWALFFLYGAAVHYRNPCLRTCGFSETCSHGFCWLPGWRASSVQMAHLHLAHSSSSGHGPDQIELFSGYFTCEAMLFCDRTRRGSCSQEGRKPRVAREWRVPGFSCL